LDNDSSPLTPTRRQWLQVLAGTGIGSAVFQRALAAQAEPTAAVTPEMIQQAEWISGITLSDADRKSLAGRLIWALRNFKALRAVKLPNAAPPALSFNLAP
jgi:hypothetical protein